MVQKTKLRGLLPLFSYFGWLEANAAKFSQMEPKLDRPAGIVDPSE